MAEIQPAAGPVVLIILDGWGHRDELKHNGILQAKTPFFDSLMESYPHTLIDGSGPAVGLPQGIMGNSEVGHMNIGSGRIIFSGLSQIYKAIEDESFFSNEALLKAVHQAKEKNSTLHLLGLLSDGAVHSHQDHLYALLQLAKREGVKKVAVHAFMDGRDTPPQDGAKYMRHLLKKIDEIGVGRVASVGGRFFAMDRDKNWDRVEKGFQAMTGVTENRIKDPVRYIEASYKKDVGDEFIEPAAVEDSKGQVVSVASDDAMIFFDFRADRARQISHAFCDETFEGFARKNMQVPAVYVCMAPYDNELPGPVAFYPSYPQETLGEIVSKQGLKQLRIAETEKYAHVTFFFNGGIDEVFAGEERLLIPSPKEVPTYDLKPEMAAHEVKDGLINQIQAKDFQLAVCNFANTDMVGHTAKPAAIKKAVETVDQCLSEIVPAVLQKNGVVFITSDHGNAETMVDDNGEPMTAHTTNLVPLICVSEHGQSFELESGGRLCDVAPTLMQFLGLPQPAVMTGRSLIL